MTVRKITLKDDVEFEPDEWLKVRTDSKESARKFFGAPPNWPVKFDHFDEKGRVFKVLATGLTIK